MPKRIGDESDDELTGMHESNRRGAADAARAADTEDVRESSVEPASYEHGAFDPSSRGDETGETF
jgi:hypothetical protein